VCEGGLALPPGGPIQYANEAGKEGGGGLLWYGTPPVVGKAVGVEGRWGGKAVLVAAGYTHSVVVSADGGVWACGLNTHGQLGVGDLTARQLPTHVPFFRDVHDIVQVACGGDHTLVLLHMLTYADVCPFIC
jgi:hypothetical protein